MNSVVQKHSAAASYAFLMLVVGLPVWWKTTEVYRAPLPYSEISELADLNTKQKADIFLLCLEEEEAHLRAPILQKILIKSTSFDISLNVKPPYPSERRIVEESSTLEELDTKLGQLLLRDSPGSVALVEVPSNLFQTVPHLVLGNYRLIYYSTYTPTEELAALVVDTVLGEPRLTATLHSLPLTPKVTSRPAPTHSTRKRSSGKVDLFLTLLVPQPEHVTASWEIEAASDLYLRPFLDSFPLDFTLKSQVLYLTPLDIPATQYGSGPLDLTPAQLGLAVNSVETALASQASAAPALNLLVYLPPIERSPLTVQGSSSNSFLIPRWGGVHIYNYLGEEEVKFPLKLSLDMKRVVGVWLGQLRELLGVGEQGEGEALPVPQTGLRVWERDFQLRHRALEYLLDSVSTLSSLSHLLSQIPNIVISDEVGSQVVSAVARAREGATLVREGKLLQGFTASQDALQLAEAAFFDKSLLALLYFPDDQKYAIYIPYFLPVGIPVLLSLRTLLKHVRGGLKPKTD